MIAAPALKLVFRAASLASWLLVTALSLVPAGSRPRAGVPVPVELAAAFFLAALMTRFTFQHTRSRWQMVAFVTAAAVLQLGRLWTPDQSARLANWAASSAGAIGGVLLAKVVLEPGVFGLD